MDFRKKAISNISNRLIETITEPVTPIEIKNEPAVLQAYVRKTALKTASISAALAVPGGVAGFVSMIPEVAAIWKLQAQMVSSIALSHGYEEQPGREQMIWCMFRQFGLGVVSKYVFRQGGVYVSKKMSGAAFQSALKSVGLKLITQQGGRGLSRIVPIAGSLTSGALSFRDTTRVGSNALRLYTTGVRSA